VSELEDVFRTEWGRILSALIQTLGDFDLAEEVLQEAFSSAVVQWANGAPRNPRAWLYATAKHRAIDIIRRRTNFAQKQTELVIREECRAGNFIGEDSAVPDERLRLIFTCCHPALPAEAQIALTLRTLCGLTTEEIARAFLLPTATIAQRLVRAKTKIRKAGIPYRVPSAPDVSERLAVVMAVVYLVFNEGYSAALGDTLVRQELCAEAIRLARLLRALLPEPEPELDSLLALMLLHDSRRGARVQANGDLVLLAEQDRTHWNGTQIDEGCALIQSVFQRGPIGAYAIEAAIAALHASAPTAEETDWRQISTLYSRLFALHRSPVVALNRAVALSMAEGPEAALPLVEALQSSLEDYHLWHATRADLLRRIGRNDEAISAYQHALELAQNEVERKFLNRRLKELGTGSGLHPGS
jgi:RNA polymerase sigma-70 factor, ECF subfamily